MKEYARVIDPGSAMSMDGEGPPSPRIRIDVDRWFFVITVGSGSPPLEVVGTEKHIGEGETMEATRQGRDGRRAIGSNV